MINATFPGRGSLWPLRGPLGSILANQSVTTIWFIFGFARTTLYGGSVADFHASGELRHKLRGELKWKKASI